MHQARRADNALKSLGRSCFDTEIEEPDNRETCRNQPSTAVVDYVKSSELARRVFTQAGPTRDLQLSRERAFMVFPILNVAQRTHNLVSGCGTDRTAAQFRKETEMNAMNPADVKRTMTLEELGALTDLNMLKVMSVDELWGFGAERGRHVAQKVIAPEVGTEHWTREHRRLVVNTRKNAILVMESHALHIEHGERECPEFMLIATMIDSRPDREMAWESFEDGVEIGIGLHIRNVTCPRYYLPGELDQSDPEY
ncbi:hypothetical protein [Caballeronia sp. SBC2]|uniref:hypothetical protein n=1 Tax=Caballeronia sp. SBC2 TaxID=2705547 RepID=UPI0013EB3ACC|nr:hypothetical protein [Caballeronia sp. SBC2]